MSHVDGKAESSAFSGKLIAMAKMVGEECSVDGGGSMGLTA